MLNDTQATEVVPESTLSLASSWSEILPVMLALISDGKPTGRVIAEHELRRMASVADLGNQALDALQQLIADGHVAGPAQAVLGRANDLKTGADKGKAEESAAPGAGPFGTLAKRLGGGDLELQVCYSACGFYLGTFNEHGAFSRESKEYWPTNELARAALFSGNWMQREQP